MAQLYFRYGAMNSGKSIEILKVAHNYEEQNKSVLIFTSALDNRDEVGYVSSRIGLRAKAISIHPDTNIFHTVEHRTQTQKISCVLIDEVQFLHKEQIQQLTDIVDELHIPVMGFGLKNDFQNEWFEGSKYMLLYADKIEEMKTICWFCERKATMNLRIDEAGRPIYSGEQIQIGGNDTYYPVCRKCHKRPPF
ncbi:thymidine kinase [Paenibacillus aquistagni]|uniref:Thymidine kinase n=1 Tax=Paenibacillus aquistagni TaxID=1852522 RepID=A0A1X7IT68_9BACL|nr:thymidine kinase [Paenibacillus aquistagni]SMG17688.1 thymidine kinase [Paenibacillus aquistagni]